MYKNTKYYFIVLIILASCAVVEEPSGGPKDTTPPEIVSATVENLSTNFKAEEIEVEFSKYMSNNKVTDNIIISPEIRTDYSWSGKTLSIEFEEPLKENTTYSVQFGTDYTDWKNNKPAESFNLVFSTGNIIDTGMIEGVVPADPKELEGVFVFLFRIDNIDPDTLNPTHSQPDYKIQLGTSGKFKFLALKDGTYRLFAVKDKFKDGIIDIGMDNFSAAIDDVFVKNGRSKNIKILLGPPPDNSGPMIQSIISLDSRTTEVRFNEVIDINSLNKDNFSITIDDVSKLVDVSEYYQMQDQKTKLIIISENPLDTSFTYRVTFESLKDTLGNVIADTARSETFNAYESTEYPAPEIVSLPFKDSTELSVPQNEFLIEFNTAIKEEDFVEIFTLFNMDDSTVIEVQYELNPANLLHIKGIDKLTPNQWYVLRFNPNRFKTYYPNAFQDILYNLRFKNYDERNIAKVSGKIDPIDLCENMVLEFNVGDVKYITKPDENGNWKLDEVQKGKYNVKVICDKNNNGKYDHGFPYPFEHAENFYILEKEILVRAGWDIEELILTFEE